MGVVVAAAGRDRLADVEAVLGGPRARPDSCWCQRFRRPAGDDHRAALHREVCTAEVPIGLIAEVDGVPAGWSRVVPRESLPGIVGNRALARVLAPDEHAWWVACVVVRRAFRGRGVGAALVRAAIPFAGAHGASVLEGHPVDVAASAARPSPAALFTGTRDQFAAAGFAEATRTAPARPVMRWTFDLTARIQTDGRTVEV